MSVEAGRRPLVEDALQRALEEVQALKARLGQEKLYREEEIRVEGGFEEIVGQSAAVGRILSQIDTVAPANAAVLIQGEIGTGKELIARAIHRQSSRFERTFVKVDCAAMPSGLLESELFGHGERVGRFEVAHQGTIFLDEVTELPLEIQDKLLRVLRAGELEQAGGTRAIEVDARLIAATRHDLRTLVSDGKVREGLFRRLHVFPILVPPLRERAEDIPLLVHHFARRHAAKLKKRIALVPSATMAALARRSWPGNIRELENLIERSVILSRNAILDVPLGASPVAEGSKASPFQTRAPEPPGHELQRVEREAIATTLGRHGGNVARAARELGIARSTLYLKMRKYVLEKTLANSRL